MRVAAALIHQVVKHSIMLHHPLRAVPSRSHPLLARAGYGQRWNSNQRRLGGAVGTVRVPTMALVDDEKSTTASSETTSSYVEFQIRQQLTAPPGGVDPSIDVTGRFVWPSAIPLLQRLQQDFSPRKTSPCLRILELGAGCGVLGIGIAATMKNVAQVTLTDQYQSIEWLQANVDLNRDIVRDVVQVEELTWGEESQGERNWDYGATSFDVIVGSDVLYAPAMHKPLLDTIQRFTAPVYLAYPLRGVEHPFVEAAQDLYDIETCLAGRTTISILRSKI
jgi:hypothetical protein